MCLHHRCDTYGIYIGIHGIHDIWYIGNRVYECSMNPLFGINYPSVWNHTYFYISCYNAHWLYCWAGFISRKVPHISLQYHVFQGKKEDNDKKDSKEKDSGDDKPLVVATKLKDDNPPRLLLAYVFQVNNNKYLQRQITQEDSKQPISRYTSVSNHEGMVTSVNE